MGGLRASVTIGPTNNKSPDSGWQIGQTNKKCRYYIGLQNHFILLYSWDGIGALDPWEPLTM